MCGLKSYNKPFIYRRLINCSMNVDSIFHVYKMVCLKGQYFRIR